MHKSSLWNILKVLMWQGRAMSSRWHQHNWRGRLLARGEQLIDVNLAQYSVMLTKDSYCACSTACSLPCSFLTFGNPASFPLSNLHFPFYQHFPSRVFYSHPLLLALNLCSSVSNVSTSPYSSAWFLMVHSEWQHAQLLRVLTSHISVTNTCKKHLKLDTN